MTELILYAACAAVIMLAGTLIFVLNVVVRRLDDLEATVHWHNIRLNDFCAKIDRPVASVADQSNDSMTRYEADASGCTSPDIGAS